MSSTGKDRRKFPRSKRKLPVIAGDSADAVLNHVDNISANGVLCHTVKPLSLMTRMRIVIDLPQPADTRVNAEGVVVRCDPDENGNEHFKVAILFTKIADKDHDAIQQFVEHDLTTGGEEA
ncbi:MAG: PilZ domain-containing protein [Candidatus Hydrogenedentota bacterium]